MKAADYTAALLRKTMPKLRSEEEQTWEASDLMAHQDAELLQFWASNAPGSGAPECLMAAALQSLENKGMRLENYAPLLEEGLKAAKSRDFETLLRMDMRLRALMRRAVADPDHPAQQTRRYKDWEDFAASVDWPQDETALGDLSEQIAGGWLGQLVGAAVGTALEGYISENITKTFGEITSYPRQPNTYNDDITFELAFLEAYLKQGPNLTADQIAENWTGQIPLGWSAEGIALASIRRGILPPESGTLDNPFDEWIGAQMRGLICGMVVPGRTKEAARLAWMDGSISHTSNGILGEVFNAILAARAPLCGDLRLEISKAVSLIPAESEYGQVIRHALTQCHLATTWQEAWAQCDQKYIDYNWIHAYPNAAAQIIALWFGNDDFDETLKIICGCGHDVDCNAAQMLGVLGLRHGRKIIASHWSTPLLAGDIITYMRRPKSLSFDTLVAQTLQAIALGKA